MSEPTELQTQVMIIGGGPVGLCLAVDLGRRGIDCVVLERRQDGDSTFPTANHISARTMEHLRQVGLSQDVRSAFRADWGGDVVALTHIGGHEVARIEDALAETTPRSDSPEGEIWAPKPYFDPILLNAAKEMPQVDVRFGTTVDTISQDENAVSCKARDRHGNTLTIRSSFAVGCDGAASGTRDSLGIELLEPEPSRSFWAK